MRASWLGTFLLQILLLVSTKALLYSDFVSFSSLSAMTWVVLPYPHLPPSRDVTKPRSLNPEGTQHLSKGMILSTRLKASTKFWHTSTNSGSLFRRSSSMSSIPANSHALLVRTLHVNIRGPSMFASLS